jgi:hypothetical protein
MVSPAWQEDGMPWIWFSVSAMVGRLLGTDPWDPWEASGGPGLTMDELLGEIDGELAEFEAD